jgi:uncharacterized protein (DUF2252 family)
VGDPAGRPDDRLFDRAGLRESPSERLPTTSELLRYGRTLRSKVSRREQGALSLPPRRDPIAILEEENGRRIPDLVPIRMGRMLESPFAYYRGTAGVMAFDLTNEPVTEREVVCCGDAHIGNFGLFASPERRLLFDLNDFDEASNAPWEWDVKRFAASVVVGARDNGLEASDCRDIAEVAVGVYRTTMHDLFEMSALERYYFHVEAEWLEENALNNVRPLRRAVRKARTRTSEQVLEKLTEPAPTGGYRLKDVPHTTRHVDYVSVDEEAALFEQYRNTLRADTALLLAQFTLVDYVLRVVGVGSVGTRCYLLLFVGPSGEPLFLQVKEAGPSVLERYGGHRCRFERLPPVDHGHQGYRVVAGQRILQAHGDRFLGWIESVPDRSTLTPTDFYFRQFRDMKASLETRGLRRSEYAAYVSQCAGNLARAHSQSPGAAAIAGYLGNSGRFDAAVAAWSVAYADQAERDFAALEQAVRTGRLAAEHGV